MALVLLVDDFPEARTFLARVVARAGHRSIEAADGQEALELARRERPSLVISDIMMPTIDGFELVRQMRADPHLRSTPVILTSAAYHHTEATGLAAGLNVARVLVKPLFLRDTIAAVVALIGSAGSIAPEPVAPRGRLEFLASSGGSTKGRRLVDIIELGEALASAPGPRAVLDTFCRGARDLMGARAALAVICDPVAHGYRGSAAVGWPPHVLDSITRQIPDGGALRHILDGRPTLRLSGTLNARRDLGLADSFPRFSFLGVRMSSTAFPAGALAFVDSLAKEGFTDEDEQLAVVLAAQGAVAYEKSMLLVEAQQRAHDLAAEVSARRKAEGRLHALSQRLVQVQEEERRHLARELHDEIGQLLTGFKLKLEAVAGHAPRSVADQLSSSLADVRDLIGRARDLSQSLRPSLLDDLGLQAALVWHTDRFSKQTGIATHLEHDGLEERLPGELEIAIYRIVQEALTNVARHAGTKVATVRVTRSGGTLEVAVADRGAGFDPSAPPRDPTSSGLTGMAERAAAFGGRLTVTSQPGAGTRVTATLPIPIKEAP